MKTYVDARRMHEIEACPVERFINWSVSVQCVMN